jgi:predicted RNA-binding Zn-ribbon protein involved in translation (DUF1610 family)
MSESTGSMVECPICGEQFDPQAAGGWCTNSECGEWQYDGAEVPDVEDPDEGTIGEPADEDDDGASTESADATATPDRMTDMPKATGTESSEDDPSETADEGAEADSENSMSVSDIVEEPDLEDEPAEPDLEDEPAEPDVEGEPAEPDVEGEPAEPDVEDETDAPDVEDEPAEPDLEGEPAEPDVEDETDAPDVEDEPAEPDVEDQPGEPDLEDETDHTEDETEDEAEEETFECPGCGETLDTLVSFCPSCGEDVSEIEPGSDGEELTACPSCGADVDEDDSFCASCGQDLTSAEVLTECPGCGDDIDEDDSFCASCGEDLDAHRAGEATSSPSGGAGTDSREATRTYSSSASRQSPDPGRGGQTDSQETTEGTDDTDTGKPAPESLVLATQGEEIAVADGDTVGRELRRIITQTGGDEDEAVLVHREHVRFVRDDGQFFLVDLGKNPTRLNGRPLDQGDRKRVSPGDELDLSGVVTLEVRAP